MVLHMGEKVKSISDISQTPKCGTMFKLDKYKLI